MNVPHFFKIDNLESLSLRVSLKVSILQVPRLKHPLHKLGPTAPPFWPLIEMLWNSCKTSKEFNVRFPSNSDSKRA